MSQQPTNLPSARRPRPGRPRKAKPEPGSAAPPPAPMPRLLDLAGAARYLGVSIWTIRELDAARSLRRVRVRLANGGELRKVLFDVEDLGLLIDTWKE